MDKVGQGRCSSQPSTHNSSELYNKVTPRLLIDSLGMDMLVAEPEPVATSTFFINSEDVRKNCIDTRISPSLHAVHLHFMLPVKSCHRATVQVSIIPFSLPGFQGQTFHYSQGAFASCCDKIHESDITPLINDSTETIYKASVPWHKWNLRAPGFW